MFIPMQDAQIKDQQADNDRDKRDPEIYGCTEKFTHQGAKQRFHRRTISMFVWSGSDITTA